VSDESPPASSTAADRRFVTFGLGLVAVFVLAAFLPDFVPSAAHGLIAGRAHARIVSLVKPSPSPGAPGSQPGAQPDGSPPRAIVTFLDGPYANQEGEGLVQGPSGQLQLPDYEPGDDVLVEFDSQPDGSTSMAIIDRWRLPLLGVLVGLFAVVAATVAGWRGLRALLSLALTLVLTIRLFIPLVIAGWSPVGLAIVFGVVITVLSFMLTQGLTRTTLAAIAGTSGGLALTGILAAIVTALARFTPAQGSDQVVYLQQAANGRLDLSGLLLAAVIFGGLGVLNDVAISQAATVEELHRANPALGRRQLFTRTMNVGIAHLAATINTLVLAYLGTALPLIVLLALQVSNLGSALNEEAVAVEIVRTIVGAIGVLAAVPLTTAIACRWLAGAPGAPPEPPRRAAHLMATPRRPDVPATGGAGGSDPGRP
jgi:uncharacterized membrane protein